MSSASVGHGLVLASGGHDHYYLVADVNGAKLVKSSADFVHTTLVEIWLPTPERARVRVETTQAMRCFGLVLIAGGWL